MPQSSQKGKFFNQLIPLTVLTVSNSKAALDTTHRSTMEKSLLWTEKLHLTAAYLHI